MRRRLLSAIAACGAPVLLGGCVAAVVPLAASGALITRDRDKNSEADKVDDKEVQAKQAQTPEVIVDPAPESAAPEGEPPAEPEQPAQEASSELPAVSTEAEPASPEPVPASAPLPNPAPPQSPPMGPVGPTDFRAYDVMYTYVDLQARRDPVETPRQSAVLAAPGSLSPIRTDCSIRPPAVLFDLDPMDGTFDPADATTADPSLPQMLAALRMQEIEIFWSSTLPAVRAGEVRKALTDSGLDPRGRDGLLLMRNKEDRKQARIKDLSETHCLVAIAGDRRADFDELYLYLRDKSAAQPLEELIGAGWFLTPLPLNAPSPLNQGQSR